MTEKSTPAPIQQKPVQRMFSLDEREKIEKAEPWIGAKLHDRIIGQLVSARKGGTTKEQGGYGTYPVLIIDVLEDLTKKPTGKFVAIHAFRTVLQDRIIKALRAGELKSGTAIVITYMGKKEFNSDDKSDYHDYFFEVGDGSDKPAITDDELMRMEF